MMALICGNPSLNVVTAIVLLAVYVMGESGSLNQ